MTDKENLLLERLKKNPNFQLAVDRLALEPVVSEAETFSRKVSNRINAWYQELQYSPVVERQTFTESSTPRIFWTYQELKEWITVTKFTL